MLQRFRERDPAAMAEVYASVALRLDALLKNGFVLPGGSARVPAMRDPDERAEAIQEALCRAFARQARYGYDGEGDYFQYVMVIARNVLVDQHRIRVREVFAPERDSSADGDPLDDFRKAGLQRDSEPRAKESRFQELAHAYIAELDPPMHRAYDARYVKQLTERAAGRLLQLSRKKVHKLDDRLRRGLIERLVRSGLSLSELPGLEKSKTGSTDD
jgi:RNA polymerase sigma factor (sigma-70 family)